MSDRKEETKPISPQDSDTLPPSQDQLRNMTAKERLDLLLDQLNKAA